ncbi:GIY-YIG nuclease family protein [Mesohalobacter halotolerans]|uniref:GIY-YIG nuclease family protein n=1 Tax=Mesohalobacter halotolerans TaxID=1883405 RepID=A0A4U5TSU2_9FLAO|nr:GIY-YIG nuclease family protein [Mesohalobacter halotolerans]MBS3738884.1 GIY-YIG nuclease family protein [Psychroflexus sp.]TKS57399.1 GIY-YIG nuclease family protein [Mesohalobacter halotolerans]
MYSGSPEASGRSTNNNIFLPKLHFVYIIYSKKIDRYYVGETHNVEKRLILHNNGNYEGPFTKIANDWRVVLKFKCVNRSKSIFLKKFIKRMKSRKFIEKVIQNPEILSDLLTKKY